MLWNPFQFQFNATYLADEGDLALLEIRRGAGSEQFRFPKNFLPPSLRLGESFCFKLEDNETARNGEIHALRRLLSDLMQ